MENVIFLLKTLSKAFGAHDAQERAWCFKDRLPSGPPWLFNQRRLAAFPRRFPQDHWAAHLSLLSLSPLPMLVSSALEERDSS